MADSITITNTPPELKSMQYDFLKEEGLKYIEELASKIWTDYNESDPGITMLEVLSYAITDLGYRSNYSIPDILAQNPNDPQINNQNFYTARQILPICPVTLNDYRELMIDVEVSDPNDTECPVAGVRNAWIEKSPDNEVPVYLDQIKDELAYSPVDPADPKQLEIKVLYDVLLEFDRCENLGDLNENTIEQRINFYNCAPPTIPIDPALSGLSVDVQVEFASWDEGIDWNDTAAIAATAQNLLLDFSQLPSAYRVQSFGFYPNKEIYLIITKGANNVSVNTDCMREQLQELIFNTNNPNSFVNRYQKKVEKILEIVAEVRKRLMANRNLCEDFFRINALKVEEIALCADIFVETDADIEEILAQIYFDIGNFLAPTVNFYSLSEMYEKGYRTEEIFEGPALEHGFIDPAELEQADRRETIRVSDLIQIMMDVPGVDAVENVQIANIPLDNEDEIPSVAVRWCLDLAFDKNYVPRLATERSSVTFFKEQLPYSANEAEVDELLEQLISDERSQKLYNTELDIPVPEGTYKDIDNYVSVQDEFPLVYGVGEEGLPSTSSDLRQAQAKQLKGFLLFFDQLLADYLSQLSNVRNLFSMNGERDANGDFVIDKTYFSQSLIPYVPDVLPLLVDEPNYPENLQAITEDDQLFDSRRNRFLDHLMARFSEQFTDYALLVYQIDGKKAPDQLLEDKLRFLDEYPAISGGRFKAFNYESPCKIWSVDNVSGLEKRISLLTGIDPEPKSDLVFHSEFSVVSDGSGFRYIATFDGTNMLTSSLLYETENDAKAGIEELIINGVCPEKYVIVDASDNIITENNSNDPFTIRIICNDEFLALSQEFSPTFPSVDTFQGITLPIFEREYYDNAESNRHNLSCPVFNYFNCVEPVVVNMATDAPTYYLMFDLFQEPFIFDDENKKLLTGAFVAADNQITSVDILAVDPALFTITVANNLTSQFPDGGTIDIADSAANDGTYTIASVEAVIQSGELVTIITLGGSPVLSTTSPLGIVDFVIQTAFKGYGECKTSEDILTVDLAVDPDTLTVQGDLTTWIQTGDPISISGSADNDGDYAVDTISVVPVGSGFETTIGLVEPLISNVLPLGNLKYNQQSAEDLIAQVQAEKEELLFRIVEQGVKSQDYAFTDWQLEDYRFFITDDCGDPMANAIEVKYNESMTTAIASQAEISIVNSTMNDGVYTVDGTLTVEEGSQIKIVIEETIPSLIADGDVQFSESGFAVISVDHTKRQFVVATDLSRKIFVGDTMTITGSFVNSGDFTTTALNYNPITLNTTITVEETVNEQTADWGTLGYTQTLPIQFVVQNTTNSEVYVQGGGGTAAVNQMIGFLTDFFFSHEGLHLVEHVLLRPKYNEDIYIDFADGATPLDDSITTLGSLSFMKQLPVNLVDAVNNAFQILGDITAELAGLAFQTVYIQGSESGVNDGAYTLVSSTYDGTTYTNVVVFEEIPVAISPDFGFFVYPHSVTIDSIPTTTSIEITVPDDQIALNFPVSITASEDDVNNGNYQIQIPPEIISAAVTELILRSRETLISDTLLSINANADCNACQLTNPYSFLMTVVMPAWQGRFANQDFRNFFDRSFRLECPAHLVPNICWVNCEQMDEFEVAYKRWLLENSKQQKNALALSKALNDLIEVLSNLRSVYPEGTLHDCNVDETLENAIILNQTEIGTI